jgi:hypothetical protein
MLRFAAALILVAGIQKRASGSNANINPNFPSVVLKPGQTFQNTIIYKFPAK